MCVFCWGNVESKNVRFIYENGEHCFSLRMSRLRSVNNVMKERFLRKSLMK